MKNKPPMGGSCVLHSNIGDSVISVYPVVCQHWVDPDNVGIESYTYYYYKNGTNGPEKHTLASGVQQNLNLVLPVGDFELFVDITDRLNAVTTVSLGDVVANMPTQEQLADYDPTKTIAYLKAVGDSTTLGMVLNALASVKGNAEWLSLDPVAISNLTEDELLARISAIADINLETLQSALETMDFTTVDQINVGSGILQSTLAGVFEGEYGPLSIGLEARDAAMELLEEIANAVPKVEISDPNDLKPFLSNAMDAASAIITSINAVTDDDSTIGVSPNDMGVAEDLFYETFIDSLDLAVPTNKDDQLEGNVVSTTKSRSEQQIDKIFALIDKTAKTVCAKLVVGEIISTDTPHNAALMISKLNEALTEPGVTIEGSSDNAEKIIFPKFFCPSKYITSNTVCREDFCLTSSVWPCITHLYPDSSSVLSKDSKVIDLNVDIKDERVKVTNEANPILLRIPRMQAGLEVVPPLDVKGKSYKYWTLPIIYHLFNVTNVESGYTLEITPNGQFPHNTILLLDHKRMPTPSKHLIGLAIRTLPRNSDGMYTYFVSSEENSNRTGRFFAGIGILKPNKLYSNGAKIHKNDFLDAAFPIDYSLRVYTSGCYYFDKLEKAWLGRGLKVVESSPLAVICSSSHMTPFGSGFAFAPNAIDFEFIFANFGFSDNLSIYVVLGVVTTFLILMLLWAHCMDRSDLVRRGVYPLPDNKSEDKYLYEITIKTGPDKDASCDSQKYFIASGDYDETEPRYLPAANNFLYRRFATNQFVMAVPKPLGYVNSFRVFHDNTGEQPLDSWQIEFIVVRDLQTNEKFTFDTANTWLALDRDDGEVDKLFRTLEGEDEKTFSQQMYIRANASVNQEHMWMSAFMRNPQSRYGRKERVGVMSTFLYLCLLVNAVWYQLSPNSPRNGYFDIGLLSLSMDLLFVSVIVLVVVFPFVNILAIIFKRARPKNLRECRALVAIKQQRINQLIAKGVQDAQEIQTKSEINVDYERPSIQKEKSPITCFPWWTRWLAWLLIVVSIAASIFVVWSYAIMWGEVKTVKFLSSFVISFLVSILITQFGKALFTALACAACVKLDLTVDDADCDEELPALKQNEEWAHMKIMDSGIRKRIHRCEGANVYNHTVDRVRTRLMKEREMKQMVKTIFIYCIFLAIVYILVDGRTDYNAFLMKDHFAASFIKENHLKLDYSKLVSSIILLLVIKSIDHMI